MDKQRTIRKEAKLKGCGVHTGKTVEVCFKPAKENNGINFIRVDLDNKPVIKAEIANVLEKSIKLRRTSLGTGLAQVHTVEHVLSAVFALGIDNLIIEVTGEEIPALSGGAQDFCQVLTEAGILELTAPKKPFVISEPICLKEGDSFLGVFPSDNFRVSYTLSYPQLNLNQYINFKLTPDAFTKEIAPCKTFCLETEVERLRSEGLGKGATVENTIVVGKSGVVKGKLIFPDEFVRHKVLDLIGDFCLLAPSIKAHVIALKSGHPLNIKLLRKVVSSKPQGIAPLFDIEKIMQVLPHRYPFLLVDKIIEFQEDKHVVGVKNVTMNEQFFTGHFPGRPVMPGVLILEAMAQAAGILMLSRAGNKGKLAYFMSMDKVKFRRMVVPGDQLLLDINVMRIKSRIIQIRGQALVDGKVAAEAELMFSLVPKE